MTHLDRIVETDSGIDPTYQHKSKRAGPLDPIETSGAVLKWYGNGGWRVQPAVVGDSIKPWGWSAAEPQDRYAK